MLKLLATAALAQTMAGLTPDVLKKIEAEIAAAPAAGEVK